MKTSIIVFVIAIVFVGWLIVLTTKECRSKGGMPVGYGGTDCWDDVNKTFIK